MDSRCDKVNVTSHHRTAPRQMPENTTRTFRHSAGFGKRIEYWIIGRMLKEGMDVTLARRRSVRLAQFAEM